ncbi:MAG: glycosyltransferase [Actinomycetota bacterium]|nr:glycosyltransferase [Actinomycetota bacterium]
MSVINNPRTLHVLAPRGERRLRVALYSHDALGLGHLRRNLAIAGAFSSDERSPDVLLFAGSLESTGFQRPAGCDLITLPSLQKSDDGAYGARQLSVELDEVVQLRSSILESALAAFAPDVLIVDKHPLGAFDELRPALDRLRAAGTTKIVLGLRDILDDPRTTALEWDAAGCTQAVGQYFDQVWVYGDPGVFATVAEYQLPPSVAQKVVYTGYLGDGRATQPAADTLLPVLPFVLGMVGGGQDGGELAAAFAAMPVPRGHEAVLVTGPQMSTEARERVYAAAQGRPDLRVLDSVEDGSWWIQQAAAVVCMGGYNSVCELLSSGTPGLVVPRVRPRVEQLMRAERMAAMGALDLLHPADLSAAALGGWAAVAVHRRSRKPAALDLGGLGRLPDLLHTLWDPTAGPTQSSPSTNGRTPVDSPPSRIGYVLKMYPRFSETFIVSELLAREAAGAELEIFSLRPPADGRFHESLARVRAGATYLAHHGRRAPELWQLLAAAAGRLPRLPAVLPDLLGSAVDDAAQAVDLALQGQDRGITHLHAHFGSVATTVARLASLLTGVPYSFTAHAKDIFHDEVDEEDLRRKLADAHHVVTVSAFNVEHLRAEFGAAADAVRLVYNGLDLDCFSYDRSEARSGTISAVGRLVEKKGFDVLIDACARLSAAGRTVNCEIAGTGPQMAALQARIDGHGLTGAVRLVGALSQDAVRDLLRGSSVFAAPCVVGSDGNRDGLPTVLLEAMALGTPCVGTDVTGIPEVIRDGETGFLVPQRDPAALATALARLLDESRTRTRLARNARALVEENFDSRRQAEQLDALLVAEPTPVQSLEGTAVQLVTAGAA